MLVFIATVILGQLFTDPIDIRIADTARQSDPEAILMESTSSANIIRV